VTNNRVLCYRKKFLGEWIAAVPVADISHEVLDAHPTLTPDSIPAEES
jgi:hypothetical protein